MLKEALAGVFGKMVPMPNQAAATAARRAVKEMDDKREEMWRTDVRKRKPREQQWQLNVAMVLGNQWVGWSGQTVQTLQAPSWRIQNVDNKLFVRVRSKMTRLLMDMTPTCIPDSSAHIDVRRAEYKERLLHHIRREIGDNRLRFRAAQWLCTCGEVYTDVYWDDSAGDTYAADGGAFSEGDVRVRIYDPFAVWPGAGATAGNNGGRLWTVDLMPVEIAKLKFNTDEIAADAGDTADFKLRASMENFFQTGSSRNFGVSEERMLEDMVMVRTLREYRTAKIPEGRRTVIINNKVIDEQPLLWDGLTHIINYPAYGSYHGDAVEVRNCIQQQKSYNRLRSHWEEYVRTMAKGKILVHKSCNIKSSQFDSEHMEIVKYEGTGPKPEPWMPPPLPNDTLNLMNLCVASMDDCFADHMASQGKAPASASGAAINYLTEEDSKQHFPTRDEWLDGWARTYEKCLDVIAGKAGAGGYADDRTIVILGEDRRADVQRFEPDMIAGRNRVFIACGGALPENKTLRAEVVRRWWADGVLGDPTQKETRRKFFKLVDAGIVDDIYDDEALDEIRAEWENDQLKAGEMVAPRPEDDHAVHSRTILRFMKTDEFLQMPEEIQGLFYIHEQIHAQQVAMAMTAGMPPAPGGMSGGPSAPPQGSSPDATNPEDMLKSTTQAAEPPPAVGLE